MPANHIAATTAALLLLGLATAPVRAEDRGLELVPEIQGFYKLTDVHRLYLYGNLTRETRGDTTNGEFGAHLDITLLPIFRRQLRDADWERDRYVWMRIGYEQLGAVDGRDNASAERRLMIEGTHRYELPMDIWLATRLRADFRDLNGDSAQRYRFRAHLEREFNVSGVVMVPYVEAETLYDTRFDSWNRQIYQAGAEIEISRQWRVEPYIARQNDKQSASANVDRIGLIFKYYR